jgi:hypothetical protein
MRSKANRDILGWLALSVLFALSFLARVIWLGNIPGINGDEAELGLQVIGKISHGWLERSGRPFNPFYLIPFWLIHRLFAPATWVLRLPTVLFGLLLMVLGFLLLKKTLGTITAIIFVVLAAGLPNLIAFSRFGWDPSETGLAMLIVFYFALSKRFWLCMVAEAAAVIVHPANILALIIIIFLFGFDFFRSFVISRRKIIILGILILVSAGSLLLFFINAYHNGTLQKFTGYISENIFNVSGWVGHFSAYGDLFSGITLHRDLVGPISGISARLHSRIFKIIFLPIIILGCWQSIRHKNFRVVALLSGLAAALVFIYFYPGISLLFPGWRMLSFSSGNFLLSPGEERYSFFLIVPTILLMALCIKEIFPETRSKWIPIGLAIGISCLGLFSVTINYFIPLLNGGGSFAGYQTGSVEPKAAAVDIILNRKTNGSPVTILAENWWTAKPMQYLLAQHPEYDVIDYADSNMDNSSMENILQNGGYVVGFSDGDFDTTLKQNNLLTPLDRSVVYGYSNEPIIIIWHKSSFP